MTSLDTSLASLSLTSHHNHWRAPRLDAPQLAEELPKSIQQYASSAAFVTKLQEWEAIQGKPYSTTILQKTIGASVESIDQWTADQWQRALRCLLTWQRRGKLKALYAEVQLETDNLAKALDGHLIYDPMACEVTDSKVTVPVYNLVSALYQVSTVEIDQHGCHCNCGKASKKSGAYCPHQIYVLRSLLQLSIAQCTRAASHSEYICWPSQ